MEKYIKNKQIDISYDEYCDFLYENKNKYIEELTDLVRTKKLEFPYKKFFIKNVNDIFMKLVKNKMKYDESRYFIPIQVCDKIFHPDGYGTMLITNKDYEIDILSDIYQEQARMLCSKMYRVTPYQRWLTNSSIFFNYIFDNKLDLTTENLRESMFKIDNNYYECTQFKPTVSKEIYDVLYSEIVLDFSSGYGDRLLGAIASMSVKEYHGFDPNTRLQNGYKEMIEQFCPMNDKDPKKFTVAPLPFEEANLDGIMFDTVFTSPPFFDLEIYNDQENTQSFAKNNSIENWMTNFLFYSLNKSWEHLKVNGYLVIYIGDTIEHKIIEPMNIYLESFKDSKYIGATCFSNIDSLKKRRLIWIWKKISGKKDMKRYNYVKKLANKYPYLKY